VLAKKIANKLKIKREVRKESIEKDPDCEQPRFRPTLCEKSEELVSEKFSSSEDYFKTFL